MVRYWKVGSRKLRPFEEARAYVQKLNLKSHKEWILYCKNKLKGFKEKPHDIPSHPDTYKDEWKGLGDWLVLEIAKKMRPFKEARAFVQKLNLKNIKNGSYTAKINLKDLKKAS